MFISQKEKDAISRELVNLHRNIEILFEGKRQINKLFTKDSYGTVRTKIEILIDSFID